MNEVMENYIVHKKTKAFNVQDETSGELLAQPQNIEYEAYCILHKAVFPFTLPYHQPIDSIRTYLNELKTSRHQLLDTFRVSNPANPRIPSDLHKQYIDRAVDAEFLGLTQ